MLQIYNGNFLLFFVLKESSPAVLSSSIMRVPSINKDRETHTWGCYHIYRNMLSHLLEYGIVFIRICYHIYRNMSSYLLEYVIICIYWNMSSYVFIVK